MVTVVKKNDKSQTLILFYLRADLPYLLDGDFRSKRKTDVETEVVTIPH